MYFCIMSVIIAPSLLSANFARLGESVEMLNSSSADWIHCDIMDGVFVPNISFGIPVLQAIRPLTRKVLDVHLMIQQPERYITAFRDAGADILTVHQEACVHLDRTVHAIREAGMRAGVSLNPATPVDTIRHILPYVDLVLIMSVNPGFGGQKFIPYTFDKIMQVRHMISQMGLQTRVEVDGGISLENCREVYLAGADVLVSGNAVMATPDPAAIIQEMILRCTDSQMV